MAAFGPKPGGEVGPDVCVGCVCVGAQGCDMLGGLGGGGLITLIMFLRAVIPVAIFRQVMFFARQTIARHNPPTGMPVKIETNGGTKKIVVSDAPRGAVLTRQQELSFTRRTRFTPNIDIHCPSGITRGGLRARANAGMLFL